MCSTIAARRSGRRSAKRIRRSNFACACCARKSAWYRYWRRPAASICFELEIPRISLSHDSRRATENRIVYDAAHAIREHGLGLKAATITPEGRDDIGSPNRILREEIGGRVIVRTGRRIPGVIPLGGVHAPISIVRMAVGDAYGAKEWREGEGDDEVAFRTER